MGIGQQWRGRLAGARETHQRRPARCGGIRKERDFGASSSWTDPEQKKAKMRKYFGHLCCVLLDLGFFLPRHRPSPNSSNANGVGFTSENCECFFLLMMQRWAELNEEEREDFTTASCALSLSFLPNPSFRPSFLLPSFPSSTHYILDIMPGISWHRRDATARAKYSIEYQCMNRNLILSRSGSQCESGSSSLPLN